MLTEEYIECPECKFDKAFHHYGSMGYTAFIACPKCHFYSEFGEKKEIGEDPEFWAAVEKQSGYGE